MHGRRFLSSGIVALLALVLFLAARGAWAQGGPPLPGDGGAPEENPGLESILDLVRGQKKLIDRQEKTIGALEKRLAEVESLALSSHNRLEEMGERTPDTEVSEAVEERLAELESSIEELPERADIVAAGEFPGSFRIPGTDAAIKIGGQVRFTGVSSLNAIGSEDRFVTSSIPIAGTEEAGKESRVTYIASPSRLNFDMRTPPGWAPCGPSSRLTTAGRPTPSASAMPSASGRSFSSGRRGRRSPTPRPSRTGSTSRA